MARVKGEGEPKLRTMEEFAVLSGISRPTLSRFFADPSSVRPASRERIEAAMARFGYRPNLMAVNFNRRKPKVLGLLVPSLTDPFYAGLVQHIERLAAEAGYWTILQNAQGSPAGEAAALSTLLSLNVAAAILAPLGHASRAGPFAELSKAAPTVFLDTRLEGAGAFVGTDNASSVPLMVDYLCRSGSAPIYFDMPDVNRNARERRAAFETAMASHGEPARILPLKPKGWDFERLAMEEAARLFSRRPGAYAGATLLCANDRIAFGVMAAASGAGLSIGRGEGMLRIAGHDDHPLSRYACPSLTTVAQNQEGLAERALSLALQAIRDGAAPDGTEERLPALLAMRASA